MKSSASNMPHDRLQAVAQPFDVYARPFVPEELRSINIQPATVLETPPGRTIAFDAYASSFIPPLFLHRRPTVDNLNHRRLQYQHLHPKQPVCLSPEAHAIYFCDALKDEGRALDREFSNYALYQVTLQVHHQPDGASYCVLHVPGLRENSPHIELEDVVSVRQLTRVSWNGALRLGFSGYQYNARVHYIAKAKELVTIRIAQGETLMSVGSGFNVCFNYPYGRIAAQQLSLALIQDSLDHLASTTPDENPMLRHPSNGIAETSGASAEIRGQREASWTGRMLFPTGEDGTLQTELTRLAQRDLFDEQLNFEQQKAVDSVCQQNYGEVPFLVCGPPGTGKTKTIVECVLQTVSNDSQKPHILLCAPSDPAADTLTQRLSQHLQFGDFLRLNAPTRTFAEVPQNLMPHCFIDHDHFALPAQPQLLSYKVVVTTCRDAAMLVAARVTNQDLFALEHGVTTTLHPEQASRKITLHWGALMIDEAAQATEPEATIPISVVAPPRDKKAIIRNPILVMAGDHMQLGPRAKTAALKISLFERLFNRPLYKDHPLARNKNAPGAPSKPLDRTMLPITRPPFANLVRNYRSHPAILAVPSNLFYHDTLIPEAKGTDALRAWPGWQGRGWPVLFHANAGPDEMDGEGGGWYNVAEARAACATAQSLARTGLVKERDICIMSPFRAQVRVLRTVAREPPFRMWSVNIGPMEAFQGLEARAVIVCTTRARPRFLDRDVERGLGVVHEPKRFNVALTRAKEALVVIGNPHVLAADPCWATFLGFCRRNGLWVDGGAAGTQPHLGTVSSLSSSSSPPPLGPGLDTGTGSGWQAAAADCDKRVSALETGLVTKEAIRLDITSDYARFMAAGTDDEMWVSGMLAALAMDEGEGGGGGGVVEGDEQAYGDTRVLEHGETGGEHSG